MKESELPKCTNHEKCGNIGMLLYQGKFYCGECWQKIQDHMDKKKAEAITEALNE